MKICVLDERSEIAACHLGIPQNDMGMRTDVLSGCEKSDGMILIFAFHVPTDHSSGRTWWEKGF